MIALCRSTERQHVENDEREIWSTIYPGQIPGETVEGFGALIGLAEERFAPGVALALPASGDAEIVTFMSQGGLAQQDSTGGSGLLHTGEFQRLTRGRGVRHQETNFSHSVWSHLFRILLQTSEAGLACDREQKRFAFGERHNRLCVIASPDAREGSLRVHLDAVVYSGVLDSGRHLVHELLPGRSAWIHIISGRVNLHDVILTQGDGAGIRDEPAVSLTPLDRTEMLMLDLGPAPVPLARGVVP